VTLPRLILTDSLHVPFTVISTLGAPNVCFNAAWMLCPAEQSTVTEAGPGGDATATCVSVLLHELRFFFGLDGSMNLTLPSLLLTQEMIEPSLPTKPRVVSPVAHATETPTARTPHTMSAIRTNLRMTPPFLLKTWDEPAVCNLL
jgi:hypothetical protein